MKSRRASWRRRTERESQQPAEAGDGDEQSAREAARASLEISLTEAQVRLFVSRLQEGVSKALQSYAASIPLQNLVRCTSRWSRC